MGGHWYVVALVAGGFVGALLVHVRAKANSGSRNNEALNDGQRACTAIRSLTDRTHDAERELGNLLRAIQSQRDDLRESIENAKSDQPAKDRLIETDRFIVRIERLVDQLKLTRQGFDQQMSNFVTATELRVDPVTQLANRFDVDRWTQILLALMSRYGNEFSVAVLDVDHFLRRSANMTAGETRELISNIAQRIRKVVRETDIVARYEDDEFVVLMPETDLSGAVALAERLRQDVEKDQGVTVSIGATAALSGDSTRTLLTRADAALYAAKAAGRNRVYCHSGLEIHDNTAQTSRHSAATPGVDAESGGPQLAAADDESVEYQSAVS